MVFVRTTPPRPVEVTAVFPELAPLARPAIRLHPRPGSPSVGDSSVGGPLLWPAGEPWPHCEDAHLHGDSGFRQSPAEVRLDRHSRARRHEDPYGPSFTPEEEAAMEQKVARLAERLDAGPPWPEECPVPLLPVAQLYVRDVPLLRPPGNADLLQVLWCPYDHEPDWKPATAVFWRSAASVVDVLATPPEPYEANYSGYVPEPCLLAPEAITEYPNSLDLSPELRKVVGDWSRWQAAGADVDGSYAEHPAEFYDSNLANAPGWKVGGWPPAAPPVKNIPRLRRKRPQRHKSGDGDVTQLRAHVVPRMRHPLPRILPRHPHHRLGDLAHLLRQLQNPQQNLVRPVDPVRAQPPVQLLDGPPEVHILVLAHERGASHSPLTLPAPPDPLSLAPLSSSRSCKRAAGLRARHDCCPLSNG